MAAPVTTINTTTASINTINNNRLASTPFSIRTTFNTSNSMPTTNNNSVPTAIAWTTIHNLFHQYRPVAVTVPTAVTSLPPNKWNRCTAVANAVRHQPIHNNNHSNTKQWNMMRL